MADPIHRTLIIRFSSVGDIVLSSLLLRTLHARFPACRIDYLVKEEYADLVRFNPHVANVISFPANGGIGELSRIREMIRHGGYDLIVDIHDSLRSRVLCLGMSNVVRIRKRKLARFLLVRTHWDAYGCFGGAPSVAERYLEPVEQFGVQNDGGGLELLFPVATAGRVKEILAEAGIPPGGTIIGVCPGARHGNKMWMKDRFAEAAFFLARGHGAAVLLFGSGTEEENRSREIATTILRASPATPLLNLTGKLSLLDTAAMMDHCSVILCNDSGLMHVAAARKRNVVAVFGPTVRELGFFPYGTRSTVIEDISLPCRPCTHIGLPFCPKGHFKCMKNIETMQVVDAARLLLGNATA